MILLESDRLLSCRKSKAALLCLSASPLLDFKRSVNPSSGSSGEMGDLGDVGDAGDAGYVSCWGLLPDSAFASSLIIEFLAVFALVLGDCDKVSSTQPSSLSSPSSARSKRTVGWSSSSSASCFTRAEESDRFGRFSPLEPRLMCLEEPARGNLVNCPLDRFFLRDVSEWFFFRAVAETLRGS